MGGIGAACSYYIQGVSTNYAVRYEEDTGKNEEAHKVDTFAESFIKLRINDRREK